MNNQVFSESLLTTENQFTTFSLSFKKVWLIVKPKKDMENLNFRFTIIVIQLSYFFYKSMKSKVIVFTHTHTYIIYK